MSDLAALAWPLDRLPEAIEALARRAGMKPAHAGASPLPPFQGTPEHEEFEGWLDHVGATFGIEVEPVLASGAEMEGMLRAAGPALLRYRAADASEPGILLLLHSSWHTAQLLSPDLSVAKVRLETVRACLCADAERPVIADVDALLDQTNIGVRQRPKIRPPRVKPSPNVPRLNAPIAIERGTARRPQGAGLGIEISEARVARFRLT